MLLIDRVVAWDAQHAVVAATPHADAWYSEHRAMRRVLVTGSSRGIGRAIALRLAQQGFAVTVHCRQSRSQADALAAEIKASVLAFDVRDRRAAQQVLDGDVRTNGAYYGVVLN